eukprot:353298-Chlamydomonas_euryale.AAC.4
MGREKWGVDNERAARQSPCAATKPWDSTHGRVLQCGGVDVPAANQVSVSHPDIQLCAPVHTKVVTLLMRRIIMISDGRWHRCPAMAGWPGDPAQLRAIWARQAPGMCVRSFQGCSKSGMPPHATVNESGKDHRSVLPFGANMAGSSLPRTLVKRADALVDLCHEAGSQVLHVAAALLTLLAHNCVQVLRRCGGVWREKAW